MNPLGDQIIVAAAPDGCLAAPGEISLREFIEGLLKLRQEMIVLDTLACRCRSGKHQWIEIMSSVWHKQYWSFSLAVSNDDYISMRSVRTGISSFNHRSLSAYHDPKTICKSFSFIPLDWLQHTARTDKKGGVSCSFRA